jgi:hypothetical protein
MRLAVLLGDDEVGEHLSHRLGARPAEDPLGRAVPVEDEAVFVDGDDGVVRGVDEEPRLAAHVLEGAASAVEESGGAADSAVTTSSRAMDMILRNNGAWRSHSTYPQASRAPQSSSSASSTRRRASAAGRIRVLATPVMINLIEAAALAAG